MKSVWVMNLIDNRKAVPQSQKGNKKFDMCKSNNIIAIGWEWEKPGCGDRAYETAHRFMAEMQRGDLVWVRDRHRGDRYLCEVLDDTVTEYKRGNSKEETRLVDVDIVEARKCKYHSVKAEHKALLPKRSKLVARSVIQHMRDADAITATWELFDKIVAEENG